MKSLIITLILILSTTPAYARTIHDSARSPLKFITVDGSYSGRPRTIVVSPDVISPDAITGIISLDIVGRVSGDVLFTRKDEWLQNGFPNRTDSTLTWSDSTPDRTLTVAPSGDSFDYFVEGVKYTKTASDTIQITDTEGLWMFYYDDDILTSQSSPTDAQMETAILNKALVAYVYWDATNNSGELLEERHGKSMAPNTHRELHFTAGTTYFDGLALGDFVISDGADDEDAQFSIATGQIFDEDIKHTTNTLTKTTGAEVWYRNAGLDWRKDTQAGFSVLNATAGRLYYDNAGTLTEVTDGKWVLYHIFAWNATDANPISIMGQAEYATVKAARIGATTEINSLLLGSLPSPEMKAIGTVIFQTKDTYGNSVKARVVQTDEGDDYVDWRTAQISPSAAAGDHGALSGLTDDDHEQYLLIDGTRAMTGALDMGNNVINNIGDANTDFTDVGGLVLAESVTADTVITDVILQRSALSITLNDDAIIIGEGGASNPTVTFNTDGNDGLYTWDKTEDEFAFDDDIQMNAAEHVCFRDGNACISSPLASGQMRIEATVEVEVDGKLEMIQGSTISADTISVDSALMIANAYTFPTTAPTVAGEVISYDGAKLLWGTIPTTSPGGSDTQIQYNNSGSFGGSADFIITADVLIGGSSGTTKLGFGDMQTFIHQSKDSVLLISADSQVAIGPPGNIILGTSAGQIMEPQTDQMVSLGTQAKQFGNLYMAGVLSIGTSDAVVIAGGEITLTRTYLNIDGQGGIGDDLDTINGGTEGIFVVIRPIDDATTITVKDGTGNIFLKDDADIALNDAEDHLMLLFDGTNWGDI